MQDQNLNPYDFLEKEVEENEPKEENSLENILNHLNVITNRYDRKELNKAFKMILDYSYEPGIEMTDMHQILQKIYDNI